MSDTPALPEPVAPAAEAEASPHAPPAEALPPAPPLEPPPTPPPEPRPERNVVPWFYGFGFLVLAGAIAYLWVNTQGAPASGAPTSDLQVIQQQLQDLNTQVARLERRPTPPDLGSRVAALEQRPTSDTAALAARVAALEQRGNTADTQLAGRYDALAGRVDALSGKADSEQATLAQQIAGLEAQLNSVAAAVQQITALSDRAARTARIEAVRAALNAGQKLGDLPGAPPALTRYAVATPPTEAALRLGFPAVERAAMAASQPDTTGQPFLERAWARAQTLVTVRQGDNVVVGDAASGVLARARTELQAGDLAGAVAVLADLKGAAAAAVADWLDQAKALLAARAALTDMAEHT